jgi:hypothetical protein
MRVKEEQGRLILSDDMYVVTGICVVSALVCIWKALADGDYELLAGAGLFSLASFFTWRADRFTFDPHSRTVTWTRSIRWRKEAGSRPFDAISQVRLEMTSRKQSGLWRIVLDTNTGVIPLVPSFSGSRQSWEPIAQKIRAVIGLPDPVDPLVRDLEGLLKQGRRVEAILMHGTVTGAGHADSKRAIEDLQKRIASAA